MKIVNLRLLALVTLSAFIGTACGDMDPSKDKDTDSNPDGGTDGDTDADTDADTDSDADAEDYYPMKIGDYWTYRETETGLTPIEFTYTVLDEDEITISEGADAGVKKVFVWERVFKSDSASNNPTDEEGRIQYIENQKTKAVRHRQKNSHIESEVTKQRDFIPGFLRFDRTKTAAGDQWTETITRTDTYPQEPAKTPLTVTVSYEYKIISTNDPVTIDNKNYTCIQIQRKALSDNEIKVYWFAKGIGKVKEQTGTKIEELIDSSRF